MLMELATTQRRMARPAFGPPRLAPVRSKNAEPCVVRRIWEIDVDALFIVLALILDRCEIEPLFDEVDHDDRSAIREEVLLREMLARCAKPCRFAERAERLLDLRTGYARSRLARCPMIELAEWWSREENREGGSELGAFCWGLASDARCVVDELRRRVLSEVAIRAIRQFGAASSAAALPFNEQERRRLDE